MSEIRVDRGVSVEEAKCRGRTEQMHTGGEWPRETDRQRSRGCRALGEELWHLESRFPSGPDVLPAPSGALGEIREAVQGGDWENGLHKVPKLKVQSLPLLAVCKLDKVFTPLCLSFPIC